MTDENENPQKITAYPDDFGGGRPAASGIDIKKHPYSVAIPLKEPNLEGVACNSEKFVLGDILLVTNTDENGKENKCLVVAGDKGGMPKAALDILYSEEKKGEIQSPVADKLGLKIKTDKKGNISVIGEEQIAITVIGNIPEIRNKGIHKIINSALVHVNENLSNKHTVDDIKGMLADKGVGENKPIELQLASVDIPPDITPPEKPKSQGGIADVAEKNAKAIRCFNDICLLENDYPNNSNLPRTENSKPIKGRS